jgi:hypothetical protein
MKGPIFFSNYLGIKHYQLVQVIATFQTKLNCWFAAIHEVLMTRLPIKIGFTPILKMRVSEGPLVGMKQ